jgi:hypothetical protein
LNWHLKKFIVSVNFNRCLRKLWGEVSGERLRPIAGGTQGGGFLKCAGQWLMGFPKINSGIHACAGSNSSTSSAVPQPGLSDFI